MSIDTTVITPENLPKIGFLEATESGRTIYIRGKDKVWFTGGIHIECELTNGLSLGEIAQQIVNKLG